jgi:hypothetical protein
MKHLNFRDFFEGVNKGMFNMDDPEDRTRYEDAVRLFDKAKSRKVVSERVVKEPYEITCWRGFDERSFLRDARREGGRLLLGGDRAMEGMLWFTHSLQPRWMFDPMEYAMSRAGEGGYLLTYPLKCSRSFRRTVYDDGSDYQESPESVNATELNRRAVLGGSLYELPEGWYFTWQTEKHIGFKGELEIDESMLRRV